MDVGSLEAWEAFHKQSTTEEVAAFYEGIQAGINGEEVPLCGTCEDQDEPLDALYRKGKGKGNGKLGSAPSAAASGGKNNEGGGVQGGGFADPRPFAPPEVGQPDMRVCHWCLKMGHVMKDCGQIRQASPRP